MPVTPKNYPYPAGTDPAANLNEDIQALAEKVDESPGVRAMTEADRNLLAGAERWVGRTIWNVTAGRIESWNGASWGPAGINDHGQLADLLDDDHPQYVLDAEKGVASGIATLGADGILTLAQRPPAATPTLVENLNAVAGTILARIRRTADTQDRARLQESGLVLGLGGGTAPDLLFKALTQSMAAVRNAADTDYRELQVRNMYALAYINSNIQTQGLFWRAGTPEGALTASPGSVVGDSTNGRLWFKASGTGNTGWVSLGQQGLLARVAYVPGTEAAYTLGANGAMAVMDGTNLITPAFRVPEGKTLLIVASAMAVKGAGDTTPYSWVFGSPNEMTNHRGLTVPLTLITTARMRQTAIGRMTLANVAAGASIQIEWKHEYAGTTYAGPTGTNGQALLEVYAA